MRPTGKLHIGHYFGALQNWIRLQNEVTDQGPTYECFYFIADWHALTSDYADTSAVAQNTIEIVTDYLAAGLDPQKSVIFQQSLVPEHAELYLLLGMVTPLGWLERVPTYKEQIENVKEKDLHTYGFLGYPALQTADIVMYSSPAVADEPGIPLFVPVGEDQVSHVELSREIVRRFNAFYGLSFQDKFYSAVDLFASKPGKFEVELAHLSVLFNEAKPGSAELTPAEKEDLLRTVRRYATEMGVKNFLAKYELRDDYASFREFLTEPGVML